MVFYTRNYAYDFGIGITNPDGESQTVEGHPPKFAADNIRLTYYETTASPGRLLIDFGSKQEIDTLRLESNIKEGQLHASDDKLSWTLVDEWDITFEPPETILRSFSAETARYFRFYVTSLQSGESNAKFYELFLVKELFETKNPSEVDDRFIATGDSYLLASGRRTVYSVRGKWNGKFDFAMLSKSERDSITDLYLERKLFTVAPFPNNFPDKFFQVRFSAPPSLSYQHNIKDVGFRGAVEMEESTIT